MSPQSIFAILVIALIVGAAAFYVIRSKRKGRKCIGCPYCDACGSKKGNCGSEKQ